MKLPFELLESLDGCRIGIVKSNDENLEGFSGRIYEETRNTFKIKGSDKEIRVIKKTCDFIIEVNNSKWLVKGKALENRLN